MKTAFGESVQENHLFSFEQKIPVVTDHNDLEPNTARKHVQQMYKYIIIYKECMKNTETSAHYVSCT